MSDTTLEVIQRIKAIPNADPLTLEKCADDVAALVTEERHEARERVAAFIFLLVWGDLAATQIWDRMMMVAQRFELRADEPLADWARSIAERLHGE